ncbi:uncharacterized protein RB166_007070 [Leptodactylus fuscus]
MTLSFSDEEWLGLARWQRELYRTVMRDTMELVTSLGYIFLKKEEPGQRDSPEMEETAQEDAMSETQETVPPSGQTFFSSYSEISPTVLFCSKTVIPEHLEHSFTDEQPLNTLAKESPDLHDPQMIFTHELTPERRGGFPTTGQRTEVITGAHDDSASHSCDSGSVLEGDQMGTQDLLSDSEFLTVINVEEINFAIESEVTSLHRDSWEIHPDSRNQEECWDLQGEAVFPVALTDSHRTTNYYLHPPSGSGRLEEEGRRWVTVADRHMSTTETHKCSLCSRSLDVHEKLWVEDRTSICCTCYSHLVSDHQDPPQQGHLSLLHMDGHSGLADSAHPSSQNFTCPKCNRTFAQFIGLQRHQKTHTRTKTPVKSTAPPQRKVYRVPVPQAMENKDMRPTTCSSTETYARLHRNLQLSTAFLQQLITSTCGFQYD